MAETLYDVFRMEGTNKVLIAEDIEATEEADALNRVIEAAPNRMISGGHYRVRRVSTPVDFKVREVRRMKVERTTAEAAEAEQVI